MAESTESTMSAITYPVEEPITPQDIALPSTPGALDAPPPGSPTQGLSDAEVVARRARGLGNDFHLQTSRSYLQIVRQHAFSFINTILFAIGVALVILGRIDDAILTAGMVLL